MEKYKITLDILIFQLCQVGIGNIDWFNFLFFYFEVSKINEVLKLLK